MAVGILTIMFSSQVVDRDGYPKGEYFLLAVLFVDRRDDDDGDGQRPPRDLRRSSRSCRWRCLSADLGSGGTEPAERPEPRSGLFPAGRVAKLERRSSYAGSRSPFGLTGSTRLDRRSGRTGGAGAFQDNPLLLVALAPAAGRLRLLRSRRSHFTCGRRTPTGARRRSSTGFMSTGVKAAFAVRARARAFPSAASRAVQRGLGARGLGDRGGDDDPRDRGGRGAEQPETHAGVFEHRARRVPARRSRGGQSGREGRDSLLPRRLRGDECRRVRRDRDVRRGGAKDRTNDELRDYAGLWFAIPRCRTDDGLRRCRCWRAAADRPAFIGRQATSSVPRVGAGYFGLAIIGVLTSVISVFFYLRVVVMMYMQDPGTDAPSPDQLHQPHGRAHGGDCRDRLPGDPADPAAQPRRAVHRDDLLASQRRVGSLHRPFIAAAVRVSVCKPEIRLCGLRRRVWENDPAWRRRRARIPRTQPTSSAMSSCSKWN